MINSTSTHVPIGGARYHKVVAKQEDPHSTLPANKEMLQSITLL